MNQHTPARARRSLRAALASTIVLVAMLLAACGPGAGSTTAPSAVTPPPGETQPAIMTPAETTGLGY